MFLMVPYREGVLLANSSWAAGILLPDSPMPTPWFSSNYLPQMGSSPIHQATLDNVTGTHLPPALCNYAVRPHMPSVFPYDHTLSILPTSGQALWVHTAGSPQQLTFPWLYVICPLDPILWVFQNCVSVHHLPVLKWVFLICTQLLVSTYIGYYKPSFITMISWVCDSHTLWHVNLPGFFSSNYSKLYIDFPITCNMYYIISTKP